MLFFTREEKPNTATGFLMAKIVSKAATKGFYDPPMAFQPAVPSVKGAGTIPSNSGTQFY
jgi:hypothetical protein